MTGIEDLERVKWKVEIEGASTTVTTSLVLELPDGSRYIYPHSMAEAIAKLLKIDYEYIYSLLKKVANNTEDFHFYKKFRRPDYEINELKEKIQYFIEECSEFINDFEAYLKYMYRDFQELYIPLRVFVYDRKTNMFKEDDNNE